MSIGIEIDGNESSYLGSVEEFPDVLVVEGSALAVYRALINEIEAKISHLKDLGKEVPRPKFLFH